MPEYAPVTHALGIRRPQWVVVDTETTGLGIRDKMVEIAAVAVDPDTMTEIDCFTTLINPGRDTGPQSVHGISTAMVADAPAFEDIAAEFAAFLHGRVLVAHNLGFDQKFLVRGFKDAGIEIDLGSGFCTWMNGTRKTLAASCASFGIALQGAHRAVVDARATAQLLGHIELRNQMPVRTVHVTLAQDFLF